MDALLNLISSEQALGYIGTLFGGSALTGLAVAKKLGLKPVALVGSLFKRKKNPIKEVFELFQAVRDGRTREQILDEFIDVLEAVKPMLKEKK